MRAGSGGNRDLHYLILHLEGCADWQFEDTSLAFYINFVIDFPFFRCLVLKKPAISQITANPWPKAKRQWREQQGRALYDSSLWEILQSQLAARCTFILVDIWEKFGFHRVTEAFFYEEHLRNGRSRNDGMWRILLFDSVRIVLKAPDHNMI